MTIRSKVLMTKSELIHTKPMTSLTANQLEKGLSVDKQTELRLAMAKKLGMAVLKVISLPENSVIFIGVGLQDPIGRTQLLSDPLLQELLL